MQTLLSKLYQGQSLSSPETKVIFSAIIEGSISVEVLAAVLICLKMRGETIDEISGAAQACIEHALPFARPDYDFADIVGTGGDGGNTLNISTASAFAVTSCGYAVAKHGNRGVSSLSGSSDVLVKLGINLEMTPQQSRQMLDELGICFLLAPSYHAGFRHASPVRQQLKTRTIFNVLGPLINPARPPITLIGVYCPSLLLPIAHVLKALGFKRAAVVHGAGVDEVALHGTTQVAELCNGEVEQYTLTHNDFGLPAHELADIKGGTADYNKQAMLSLFNGKGNTAYEATVAANAALLLKLFGQDSLKHNAQQVLDMLHGGQARQCFNAAVAQGQASRTNHPENQEVEYAKLSA